MLTEYGKRQQCTSQAPTKDYRLPLTSLFTDNHCSLLTHPLVLHTRITKTQYSHDDGVIRRGETVLAEPGGLYPTPLLQLRPGAKATKEEMNLNLTFGIRVVLDQEQLGALRSNAHFFFQLPFQGGHRGLSLLQLAPRKLPIILKRVPSLTALDPDRVVSPENPDCHLD